MAKVKVVITHEEYAELELGDVPEKMFGEMLVKNLQHAGDWTLSDIGADWRAVTVKVGDEFEVAV